MWNNPGFPGELNSGEKVTEPGQALTTREIYERFLHTGRVFGGVRTGEFDSDEIGKEPGFDDLALHQRQALDITDVQEVSRDLIDVRKKRHDIQELAIKYSTGKISYDEFCTAAGNVDYDMSKPYITKFGEALAKIHQDDKNKDHPDGK